MWTPCPGWRAGDVRHLVERHWRCLHFRASMLAKLKAWRSHALPASWIAESIQVWKSTRISWGGVLECTQETTSCQVRREKEQLSSRCHMVSDSSSHSTQAASGRGRSAAWQANQGAKVHLVQGREESVRCSQSQCTCRDFPKRFKSRILRPLCWRERHTEGQFTRHWPPLAEFLTH
jgi:hypothetical protein